MSRLFIISNRLPFSIDRNGEQICLRQSSGGLVSAIKSYFESRNIQEDKITEKLWMGVADFPQEDWDAAVAIHATQQDFTAIPLFLDAILYTNYYNGFSNSVLWPLFHYFPSLAEIQESYFEAYTQANKNFAEQLLPLLKPDDIIWIHDYQLMLLPAMLREKLPHANIGFFLHIPFPSYEIFRLLPTQWRTALLESLLGADLIGFHTHEYVQHFIQSVKIVLGIDNYFHSIQYQNRLLRVELFPIGIDFKKFNAAFSNREVRKHRNQIQETFNHKKIIFSIDRLDYTKGLMDRLNSFEYFLDNYPEWKEKIVLILNVIPSRDTIKAYNERKKSIEEKIGTLNGKFSSLNWQPIIYRYNHILFNELAALYQAADIALITPLRDGMNLIAKEYVASCTDRRGVVILSELAGAASELNEALLVNPTDKIAVANAITQALNMPLDEQKRRLTLMQKRLEEYDVVKWVNDFLDQLQQIKQDQLKQQVKLLDKIAAETIHQYYQQTNKRCLLLDYDGTLSSFKRSPEEAIPTKELKKLLISLSADSRNNVVIISGRDSSTLDKWFASLPITLVAEHGASFKMRNGQWQQLISISDQWKEEIRPLLKVFTMRCAGSFIEEKSSTMAWHYRNTSAELGFIRSRELINSLSQLIQNTPLQIIDGNKVVEIRMAGLDKGTIALKIINDYKPNFILCLGDDATDEDMFKVLTAEAHTIKIGYGSTAAQYTLISQLQVLPFLYQLLMPKQ